VLACAAPLRQASDANKHTEIRLTTCLWVPMIKTLYCSDEKQGWRVQITLSQAVKLDSRPEGTPFPAWSEIEQIKNQTVTVWF